MENKLIKKTMVVVVTRCCNKPIHTMTAKVNLMAGAVFYCATLERSGVSF